MTDVYIDPSAAAMPDAADQLRHLADTGHRLLVRGEPPSGVAALSSVQRAEALPERPAGGSWLVTADVELCGDRRPPMSTMLVGPRPAASPRPAPRCDAYVRDMAAAVLEILRVEAMG